MKKLFFIFFISVLKLSAQDFIWTKQIGSTSRDYGTAICSDNLGNCYAGGRGLNSAMVYKYDYFGTQIWYKGLGFGMVNSIESDNQGFIYVSTSSPSTFSKISFDGDLIWTKNITAGSIKTICFQNHNNIFISGDGIAFAKYDSSGNEIFTIPSSVYTNSIDIDLNGNIYTTGYFSGTRNFGNFTLTALGSQDIFIAKYDSLGDCLWAQKAGGNFDFGSIIRDNAYALTYDKQNNIYVTGTVVSNFYFGNQTFDALGMNMFLAKIDTSGNLIWLKIGNGLDAEGKCIAIDNYGDILVGVNSVPSLSFDQNVLTGWGNYDAFIVKFDADGTYKMGLAAGGATWNEFVNGITIDNAGNVFATGTFFDGANFGNQTFTSIGDQDVFVSRIDLQTGLKENTSSHLGVNIYPNPHVGKVNVKVNDINNLKELSISDFSGKVIFEQNSFHSSIIEITNIPAGMYFLSLKTFDNQMENFKIIGVNY